MRRLLFEEKKMLKPFVFEKAGHTYVYKGDSIKDIIDAMVDMANEEGSNITISDLFPIIRAMAEFTSERGPQNLIQ